MRRRLKSYLILLLQTGLALMIGTCPLNAQMDSLQHIRLGERIVELIELTEQNPQEAVAEFELLGEDFDRFSGKMQVYYLEHRSWAYYRLGNYQACLNDLRQGVALSKANDSYNLSAFYLSFGHLYSSLDSLELAADNYRSSIAIFLQEEDTTGLMAAYDGLAQYYQENLNYDSALYFMERNLTLGTVDGDSSDLTSVLNNYSTVLYETGRVEEAIRYQTQTMQIEESRGDSVGLIFTYANLGRYHFGRDEAKARQYVDKAFDIARSIEANDALIELYEGFSLLETERENYKEALDYYRQFHSYRDERINADMIDRVKDWEITLDNQRKDEEIRFQKARTRNLIIIIAIVAALTALIIYSNIKIRKVKRQLERQNIELDELNGTKDKFFSIIAHDLRSPMIGLQGVGQKLEYYIRKNKQEKLLEIGGQIDRSVDQLNHLLNNLLNWASSQTGGIPHHPQQHDLKALVQENIRLYQSLAQAKSVDLVDKTEAAELYTDVNTTSAVIRNLLSNAIKFTEAGSEVLLESGESNGQVWLSITDHGAGMNDQLIDKVMHGSGYGSSSGTRGEKGFGLGLKLCREFVEINRGVMKIESKRGAGTCIRVLLPSKPLGLERSMHSA